MIYLAWLDHSCPDIVQPIIQLVHDVENSRIELSKINQRSGPVVVHCRYINISNSFVVYLHLMENF